MGTLASPSSPTVVSPLLSDAPDLLESDFDEQPTMPSYVFASPTSAVPLCEAPISRAPSNVLPEWDGSEGKHLLATEVHKADIQESAYPIPKLQPHFEEPSFSVWHYAVFMLTALLTATIAAFKVL